MNRRVVITGMGVVTPVGNDLEAFGKICKNGVSGIVDMLDALIPPATIAGSAGEVRDFDAERFLQQSRRKHSGPIVSRTSPWRAAKMAMARQLASTSTK